MANRLEQLENEVRWLYEKRDPNRAEWADWLWENHVLVVADYAVELAERYGANPELAKVAGLVHDIADSKMLREAENHEEVSLHMGRELLEAAGYGDEEIRIAIDDACRFHSCSDGKCPESLEGKILATADSLAHFNTDFYEFAVPKLIERLGEDEAKKWVERKIEKDFNVKIFFDAVREGARDNYKRIKSRY